MNSSILRKLVLSGLASAALVAGPAQAATVEFRTYLDIDFSSGALDPGCLDSVGAEQRLVTTVDTVTQKVTGLIVETCTAGTWGGGVAPGGFTPPWDVAVGQGVFLDPANPSLGHADAIETFYPLSLAPGARTVRFAFDSILASDPDNAPPVDILDTTNGQQGGAPILLEIAGVVLEIPTLSEWGLLALVGSLSLAAFALLRRKRGRATRTALISILLVGSTLLGVAWAIVPDGSVADWGTATPNATDPTGDAPAGFDIVAAFLRIEGNTLFIRIDADLNSAPVLAAGPGSPIFTEGGPAVAVDPAITVTDDGTTLASATVTLGPLPLPDGAAESLAANTAGTGITAVYTAATGVLSLTGTDTVANYQQVLRSVVYDNSSATPTVGPRNVSFVVNDGTVDSNTVTKTLTVATVNDAPSFTAGPNQTVNEDAGPQSVDPWATAISAGPADESGQTVTFNITGNSNPALFSAAPAVSATGALTYTLAANANGTATITLTLSDNGGTANGGVDTSAPQTFTITVSSVNDAPSFTVGPNQTVTEDTGPQTVDPWATAISPGPADESGQTVTFNVTGNTNPALFSAAPTVSATGVLTYTPAANTTGTATITLTLSDSGGTANGGVDTSAPQTFTITVDDVNDEPSFTAGPNQTVNEDAGPQTVNPWATAVSPGPASESGQTLTFNVTNNTNAALFSAGPAISAAGVLTYTPAANANGTASITITLQDNGGTAGGGDDTSPAQTFTITVTAVNDAPSFTVGPNQTVNEDAGAQTVNPWATAISPGPADENTQTVSFNVTGNSNPGLFTVAPAVSPTGVLTYTLAPNTSGTATITLTLSDNGGTANGGVDTSAPQTFTITVSNVNDEPSFTAGPNQTVNEDAGAQTVNPWATAISPGPANENTQTVSFNVTANTNPALFSAGPAVSPTGVLTYTPAANASGTASITITLQDNGGTAGGGDDTSPPQTFTITVNAVNDAPSFTVGPNQTINEDAGAQTVNPWATAISPGPANENTQTVSFNVTGNSNPGLFTVAPAVSPTGVLTYTPAVNASGTATITLTLSDNGGTANGGVDTSAPQTFTITVNNVNDAPSFNAGPNQTVNEDAGAQTVNPWATAISPGPASEAGQTVTFNITGNTNPALFSAGPAVSPAGVLTYTPAANAFGTATVTLTLSDNGGTANGGVDTSAPQTFTITVNAVNDAPAFTAGPNQTVNEDAGAQTVNPWATAISPGPANESGQTVAFNVTGNTNPALFSAAPAVSPTGVLTYTPATNASGAATLTLVVQDNGGTANGGVDTSPAQTFTITVNNVNDAPSFTAGPNQTVNEDAGAQTVNPWATAISPGPASEAGQTVTFNITGNTNPALFSAGPAVSPTGVLTYTPAANAFGTATITLVLQDNGGTANGGVDTSPAQTFTITVNAVNDAPSFTAGPNQTVNEDSGAQTVNPWATAISPGPASESAQTVTFNITGNTNPGLFSAGPSVSPTGVLTYTPAANASGTATITLVVQDNGGTANGGVDTSPAQTFTITVNGVNDEPSFTKGPDQTVNEDAGPQTVNPWATAISPGVGEGGQTVSFVITGNDNAALFSAGPAVSPTGVLTYTPAPNAFGVANITLVLTDNGGTANGGDDTSPAQTFIINVLSVNDPPVADDDVFDTIGNTELRVDLTPGTTPHVAATTPSTRGVLDGDADPVENNPINVKSIVGCADLTAPFGDSPACNTANGGRVILTADGDLQYFPAPGDTAASDSFSYVLTDNQPANDTDTGLVTIRRFERIWYVRNNAPAGGNGTSASPFNAITATNLADDGVDGDLTDDQDLAGDYILVYYGNGTTTGYAGGIRLENQQHLIGEHVGLTITIASGTFNGAAAPVPVLLVAQPTLASQCSGGVLPCRPFLDNPAAGGSAVFATDAIPAEIAGLNLAGNTNAIDITTNAAYAGSGDLSIRQNVVRSTTTAEGIDVNAAGTGAINLALHDNDVTGATSGIDVARTAGTLRITQFANNTIGGNTGGSGIVVNSAAFDSTPADVAIVQVGGGTTSIGDPTNRVGTNGMLLTNVTGNLQFDTLNVYNEAGTGLSASSTGALNAGVGTGFRIGVNVGISTLDSLGGPAVNVNGASIELPLGTLESTGSTTTGVSLVNAFGPVGGTALSAPNGLISDPAGASGVAFNVDGGSGHVSFGGPITNNSGRSVSITNRDAAGEAGTFTFSNTINDTGSGIFLDNNDVATLNFSGGITSTTNANPGFTATNGGTVNVTGTNTLTTTTGTALNVANTTIGSSNLNFQRISSNGAANGIVLNTTGASGGLIVTGTGAAGTGGTIQNSTGDGVVLTSTRNVSLSSMNIDSNANNGINGTTVTNLTLNGCNLRGNTNALTEAGLLLNNLLGTSTISATEVSGSTENNVTIHNTSGTLTSLTFSNCVIRNNSNASGANGISIEGATTAVMTASVSNCTFNGNRTIAIRADAADTSNLNVTISNNTITAGTAGNPQGNQGIEVSTSASAQLTYNIDNNRVGTPDGVASSPLGNTGINVFAGNTSTVSGRVTNNRVFNAGAGVSGFGIRVFQSLNSSLRANVNGNTVRNVGLDYGILAEASGGAAPGAGQAILQVAVTGNDAQVLSGALDAVRVQSRNVNTVCARISGNTTGAGGNGGGVCGPGSANFCGLLVRQANTAVFNLEGLALGSQSDVTTRTYVAGQNPAAATVGALVNTNFTGVAVNSCNIP